MKFKTEPVTYLIGQYTQHKATRKRPLIDAHYDNIDHLSNFVEESKRCKQCLDQGLEKEEQIRYESHAKYTKCVQHFCISRNRDCFREFHDLWLR